MNESIIRVHFITIKKIIVDDLSFPQSVLTDATVNRVSNNKNDNCIEEQCISRK